MTRPHRTGSRTGTILATIARLPVYALTIAATALIVATANDGPHATVGTAASAAAAKAAP